MVVGRVDLEELCRRLSDRDAPRTEATLQAGIRELLLYGGLDPADPAHQQLVRLAVEAEEIAAGVPTGDTSFQKARQRVRAALDAAGLTTRIDEAVDRLLMLGSGDASQPDG